MQSQDTRGAGGAKEKSAIATWTAIANHNDRAKASTASR